MHLSPNGRGTAGMIIGPDEAHVYRMGGGGEARIIVTGDRTDGAWWMGHFREDPGFMTTLHVHPDAEEQVYVLDGVLSVYVDGSWRDLQPGAFAVLERGVPHAQGNRGSAPVHFVGWGSPSGFEKLFPAVDALLQRGVAPGTPEFIAEFGRISASCGLRHLGPAPA